MSLFFSDFIHTRTDLTQKISDIQQQLKQLPHGKLIISHNGENIKWYSSDGHSKKYIPKSDRALAEQLALRKYLTSLLEELLQEKKAINFYDRHRPKAIKSSILLQDVSLGYSELLAPYFQLSPSHTAGCRRLTTAIPKILKTSSIKLSTASTYVQNQKLSLPCFFIQTKFHFVMNVPLTSAILYFILISQFFILRRNNCIIGNTLV